jgi:predicted phosphate transport protein (TIGR00153 family)
VEAAAGGRALRHPLNGRWRRKYVAGVFARQGELLSLIARAGANLEKTAEHACTLLMSWPDNQELVREITRCEQEGDRLTREIIYRLYRSRIGPGDRGDIYALAEAIDDVVDEIEEASEELVAYSIEAPMEQAQELAGVVRDSARALRRALDRLRDGSDVEQQVVEVRDLEHEGDRIYRQAVASLFDGGIDPMLVIRWKDVLHGLEDAIDRSRQAMDILHGLMLKHS